MKALNLILMLIFSSQISVLAAASPKIKCEDGSEILTLDPHHKKIDVIKDGKPHHLKIISQNHNAYELFGHAEAAYKAEGGLIFGVKATKEAKIKNLSVFRDGEAIASFEDCHEI